MRVELTVDSGTSWIVIAPAILDTGVFTFVIPDAPTENGFIRVSSRGTKKAATSNEKPFTVINLTTALKNNTGSIVAPSLIHRGTKGITFSISGLPSGSITCTLYSLLGRQLISRVVRINGPECHIVRLQTTNSGETLHAGAYLLRINNESFNYQRMIFPIH